MISYIAVLLYATDDKKKIIRITIETENRKAAKKIAQYWLKYFQKVFNPVEVEFQSVQKKK